MKHILIFALFISLTSCSGWVSDALTPNDILDYEEMNKPEAFGKIDDQGNFSVGPNLSSILHAGAEYYQSVYTYAGVMTDEFIWVEGGNVIVYREIEEDDLTPQNSSIKGFWSDAHNYRARALENITRIEETSWNSSSDEEMTIRQNALWYTHLHHANALANLTYYFNTDGHGNGTIYLNGEEQSVEYVMELAIENFNQAISFGDDYQKKIAYTLLAKSYLVWGNLSEAETAAASGLTASDANFGFDYQNGVMNNGIGDAAGIYGRELSVPSYFENILTTEASKTRCPIVKHTEQDRQVQGLYELYDRTVLTDFVENNLILAEVAAKKGENVDQYINEILTYFDTSAETVSGITFNEVIEYRRIYLSWRGTRMLDLRRLQWDGEKTSPSFTERQNQYFPIPDIEWM